MIKVRKLEKLVKGQGHRGQITVKQRRNLSCYHSISKSYWPILMSLAGMCTGIKGRLSSILKRFRQRSRSQRSNNRCKMTVFKLLPQKLKKLLTDFNTLSQYGVECYKEDWVRKRNFVMELKTPRKNKVIWFSHTVCRLLRTIHKPRVKRDGSLEASRKLLSVGQGPTHSWSRPMLVDTAQGWKNIKFWV